MSASLAIAALVSRKLSSEPSVETPQDKAPVERGGIIGIVVPAPVAYDPEQFLRLLIRRLAEAVYPTIGAKR